MNQINGKTNILAVIGDPIGHSMSPKMHNAAINDLGLGQKYIYVAYHVLPKNLGKAVDGFRALDIKGINVTIPHKVEIMQYLDEIEETAQKIGAINTIKNENGYLKAKNTDGEGAIKAINDAGFTLKNKKAVILGAGGASRALSFFIANEAEEVVVVNRREDFHFAKTLTERLKKHYDIPILALESDKKEEVAQHISNADLLVNTTPVGMYPKIDATPINSSLLHSNLFVFDAIYNPLKTKLIQDAEVLGCKTQSGIEMFVNQGLLAFKWWTGQTPNRNLMRDVIIDHFGIGN